MLYFHFTSYQYFALKVNFKSISLLVLFQACTYLDPFHPVSFSRSISSIHHSGVRYNFHGNQKRLLRQPRSGYNATVISTALHSMQDMMSLLLISRNIHKTKYLWNLVWLPNASLSFCLRENKLTPNPFFPLLSLVSLQRYIQQSFQS